MAREHPLRQPIDGSICFRSIPSSPEKQRLSQHHPRRSRQHRSSQKRVKKGTAKEREAAPVFSHTSWFFSFLVLGKCHRSIYPGSAGDTDAHFWPLTSKIP